MPVIACPSPPVRRGACPGVFDPMESADGWLVRVRLPGGRVTPEQLRAVARVADGFGSGVVEVTSRANLQFRGVAESALAEVGPELVAAGLAAADAASDVRRAIVASPLAGHDPSELIDVSGLVDAVLDALAAAALPPLPAKFGVVVDGGGHVGVRHVPGTICLGAVHLPDGTTTWHAASGTSLAAGPTVDLGPLTAAALAAHVLGAARTAAGVRASTPIAGSQYRNPPLQPAMGRAGHPDDPGGEPTARPHGGNRPSGRAVDRARAATLGVLAHHAAGRANVVAQVFLGRMDASALVAVAELAGPALAVRTMPGGLAVLGVPDGEVAGTVQALDALGFVVRPDDPRVGITACIGAPGCASARADTATAAARLAAARHGVPGDVADAAGAATTAFFAGGRTQLELVTPPPLSEHPGHQFRRNAAPPVHLAACEKRCGAPFGASVLVADEHGRFRDQAIDAVGDDRGNVSEEAG